MVVLLEIVMASLALLVLWGIIVGVADNKIDAGKASKYHIAQDDEGFYIFGDKWGYSSTPERLGARDTTRGIREFSPVYFKTSQEAQKALGDFLLRQRRKHRDPATLTTIDPREMFLELETKALNARLQQILDEAEEFSTIFKDNPASKAKKDTPVNRQKIPV